MNIFLKTLLNILNITGEIIQQNILKFLTFWLRHDFQLHDS